jgi:DNA polymerase I
MEVKTIVPSSRATIMLIGESPGEVEEACGKPFMGTDGTTLKKTLTQAGIFYGDCIVANTTTHRMKMFEDKKQLYPTLEYKLQLARLRNEISLHNPNIIIALGAIPLWVLCGVKGIKNYRGTILESTLVKGKKVLPVYHPKQVTYDWNLFYQSVMDFRKVSYEALTPDLPKDNQTLIIAPGKKVIIEYLNELYENREKLIISCDLEHTTPGAHISWLGISHSPDFAMSIQFLENRKPCFPESDEIEIWSHIAKLYNSEIKQVYHNAAYDVINLWHNQGVWCRNVHFDTLIAAHIMWPEFPRDLGYLASILLSVPAWKHTSGTQYEHGEYNARDTANTRALYDKMLPLIEADENYKNTFSLEMSELHPAGFMQLQGIDIDIKEKNRLNIEFSTKMKEIESGLSTILKKEINFNSPKQMQELLYVDLGLPTQYKRRKSADEPRKITTDSEALENLYVKTQDPILKLLLEHRKYTKILQFINTEISDEGKVHTSYNICGTTTGRWSSSKSIILDYGSGNLQNIDHRIRTMYKAPRGKVLVQADYVGAEAHLVAHLIQDHKLIKAFDEGLDVHIITASFMYNVPYEEVTKEQRKVAKGIRHATNYSGGPAVVAKKLGISMKEARIISDRFEAITPQLHTWHESIKRDLGANRTLITPLGRKRIFMDRWGDQLFRSAYAFIPQSTIGDLLNISLCDFYEKWKDIDSVGIIMQLHDAIYIWCSPEDASYWGQQLFNSMHRPITLPHTDLYIGVDFKVGENWKEMEKLEVTI